jgi:hypothetical protein
MQKTIFTLIFSFSLLFSASNINEFKNNQYIQPLNIVIDDFHDPRASIIQSINNQDNKENETVKEINRKWDGNKEGSLSLLKLEMNSYNPHYSRISLVLRNIGHLDVPNLISIIEKYNIVSLDFDNYMQDFYYYPEIFKALEGKNIEEIHVTHMEDYSGMQTLSKFIHTYKKLQVLNLFQGFRSGVTNALPELWNGLKNHNVKKLLFSEMDIRGNNSILLAQIIPTLSNLEVIDLSGNGDMTDDEQVTLINSFLNNQTIKVLKINHWNMKKAGASALIRVLPTTKLKVCEPWNRDVPKEETDQIISICKRKNILMHESLGKN